MRWRNVIAIAFVPALVARAGFVETFSRRIEGAVSIAEGALQVGATRIPLDQVIRAAKDLDVRTIGDPHVVRLAGGEVWRCEILSLSNGKIRIRSGLLGEGEINVRRIASIEFEPPGPRPPEANYAGPFHPAYSLAGPFHPAYSSLDRREGEPIPGPLLWIDRERIAIDSPLGVLAIKREGSIRYTFESSAPEPAAPEDADVGLIDGTILRGRLAIAGEGLSITHRIFGRVEIPAAIWRTIDRRSERAIPLAGSAPHEVRARGLIRETGPPDTFVRLRADPSAPRLAWLDACIIRAGTTVRYAVPGAAGRPAVLRARIAPAEGARGDGVVRIASAGNVLYEKTLDPHADPEPMALPCAGGADLAIEVEFGPRIAFPCAAALLDPLFILGPVPEG